MKMELGTAYLTFDGAFWLHWMNVGNFLHNAPRAFRTVMDAETFCAERGLKLRAAIVRGKGNRRW
jgi:hypothetical protein